MYEYTIWKLTKRIEKKPDGNCIRMLRLILNNFGKQHPTKLQLCGHWSLVSKTIQIRRIRTFSEHFHARKHSTAVSTLLGLISSVYRDLPDWRSNQRPQNAEPKHYHWAIIPYRTQVTPNQFVMAIARLINLNVFCKLYPYSLQRTRSPPGQLPPRRIGNTQPRNYYNLKGKDIVFIFLF